VTGVLRRRQALGLLAAALPVAAARADKPWHDIDVTGTSPSLDLTMMATPEGQTVFQNNYVGYVTMLYFGYTFCPDVCPLTMQNVATALAKTGKAAKDIRFLFVTVDPNRDTIPVLTNYVRLFGPEFVGLRGDADQLELLTKQFRIAYSVTPSPDPSKYEVIHSSAIYVFDRGLNARLLVPSMASKTPDIDGLAADLTRLVNERPPSWFGWLRELV
jgi:protein SCO1